MKVKVDQDKCIGCGACVAIASENFDFNEEGLSSVIGDEVTDETRNALEACPVYAISIEETTEDVKITKEETTEGHTCKCTEGEECTCGDECTCEENCNCKHKCECDETCDCEHAKEMPEEDEEEEEAA